MHVGSNVKTKSGAQKDLFLSLKKVGSPENPSFINPAQFFSRCSLLLLSVANRARKRSGDIFWGTGSHFRSFLGGTLLFGRDRLGKKKKHKGTGGRSVSKNYEKYPTFFCALPSTMR